MDGTGDLFRPLRSVLPSACSAWVIAYPTDQHLHFADLAETVERQLAGEEDVVLLAESYSGPVALTVAARHPSRVKAVVLVASFVRPPVPRWVGRLVWPLLFTTPPPTAALRLLLVGRDAEEALVREVKAAIRRVRPAVLAGRLRAVLSLDCSGALRDYPGPVLYLRATRDALVGASSVAAVRAVRPDVAVRTVDGPHLLLQARPEAAWREVRAFLDNVAPVS